MAGVALGDIYLRFTWQAWHKLTSTLVSRGRRGTHGTTLHPPSFHVAGVAQTRIHLGFAWQASHSWHWVARLGVVWAHVTPRHFAWQAWHNLTSTFVSRGRRGTNSHPPWFRVAGVALMALGGALGCGLGARDAAPFCVAGVAQPYIHLRFTWQAWHKLASTSFSVAGVALMALGGALGWGLGAREPRHFAWLAWHNLASTFVSRGRRAILRGRRGTTLHPPWHKLASTLVSRGRRGTHGIGWRA